MQTCGADPRGVRVEWRNGGGRTRLVGVPECGRMMGTDPNLALSVLDGLGRWEAGRSAGGMDLQRKGWTRVQDWGGGPAAAVAAAAAAAPVAGGGHPRKAPNPPPQGPQEKTPHGEYRGKRPPPRSPTEQAQGQAQAQGQGRGQGQPPPQNPKPPPLQDRGRDSYGNVPGVEDTRYVPWAEGGNGGTVSQVTVLGDWDEELAPGEWWVGSQGSNGEGGKKGKKGKREKEGGRVPGELLFRTREEAEARLREALGEADDGDDGDDGDDEGDEGRDKWGGGWQRG